MAIALAPEASSLLHYIAMNVSKSLNNNKIVLKLKS